ncbi:L,D-transpeptidase catalytic domain [Pseudonocardia thermophila]|uniref:L,D-transpeptidase catalytic domain n=1 Tax=Pseudonocardia thermophila TaxID=1848 RepID=A0A1M6YNB2_PSETH|nr:L,D-transpeptidase [Pseudonocardia thermophila]SHL19575.1 L,D-transpeptidase catalytic domain [Pseudonocardia thermophila]
MATLTKLRRTAAQPATARRPVRRAAYGAVVAVVVLNLVAALFTGSGEPGTDQDVVVAGVDATTAALPLTTTYTTIDGAPLDPAPQSTTTGLVVHPVRETPVHDAPGGTPLARLPRTMLRDVGDTWVPVIEQQAGWLRVLLPSRPNGSTGWIRAADVTEARTPYLITVHLRSKKLRLEKDGQVVGTWKVGIGKPATPTPAGRTFLMAAFRDPNQTFSPVILPLGTHSPTLDTFGGGPGTVAIHTWPTADVFGTETSDGCIRVPAEALKKLIDVPLGTLVVITED